ncbi:MAG: helix-hairpin-helix domain-containing protein [Deltaproteobacteria bacterium]|nr:MAG: helix-hairpin-helix domain-containing protein [Deltaproteobacteria bacterium]
MGGRQEVGILFLLAILAVQIALAPVEADISPRQTLRCSTHFEALRKGRPLVFCSEDELLQWVEGEGLEKCPAKRVAQAKVMLLIGDDGTCTTGRIPAVHAMVLGRAIDINDATDSDLEQLPGIGPQLARRIIELRQGLGCFCRPEQLLEVKGIGAVKLARLSRFVYFGDCDCTKE